ncbi:hypothetical protein TP70_11675 [Staphylococcus microti]|uniref:Uncharacterized protein n=1 Tax=Staphylococcus microti TaxID=569857 RepID=A0A0D6XNK4_9STAP|nr:hypothetical protein [Staphylococcus microti]KIX89811.1 hypothetical protein TP70_11675 [Staphylococcus microti]PNZ82114.1 hypothetical protein CD132_05325 [Staphylococcus microti]SUM57634.1 Uncharacterised protein [Staphylococcus microti]
MIVEMLTIFIIFILTGITVLYLSTVAYTAISAYENNVKFNFVTLFAMPFILIWGHIRIYNDVKHVDKTKAQQLLMTVFNAYPIVLYICLKIIKQDVPPKLSIEKQPRQKKKSIDRVLKGEPYKEKLSTI